MNTLLTTYVEQKRVPIPISAFGIINFIFS